MRGPAVVNSFKAMQKTGSFIFTRLVTKKEVPSATFGIFEEKIKRRKCWFECSARCVVAVKTKTSSQQRQINACKNRRERERLVRARKDNMLRAD